MKELIEAIEQMRKSRGWDKTDDLASLIKSVNVEASELLETIQWDEEHVNMSDVKSELADVIMYAVAIAIDNNWDVTEIVKQKIKEVYLKYPEKND